MDACDRRDGTKNEWCCLFLFLGEKKSPLLPRAKNGKSYQAQDESVDQDGEQRRQFSSTTERHRMSVIGCYTSGGRVTDGL